MPHTKRYKTVTLWSSYDAKNTKCELRKKRLAVKAQESVFLICKGKKKKQHMKNEASSDVTTTKTSCLSAFHGHQTHN